MATKKPRIQVTVEPSEYAILKRLSNARGVTMSCVVAELVQASIPILEHVVSTLEKAKLMDEGLKDRFRAALTKADDKLSPMVQSVVNQLDLLQSLFDDISHGDEVERDAEQTIRPVPCEPSNPPSVITGVRFPTNDNNQGLKKPAFKGVKQ